MGVTELAGAVGLTKTTTHGLLRTLLAVGFVEQDQRTGRYTLGAGLLGLGSHYLDANELRSRASNWADSLAARSGFAVRLGTDRKSTRLNSSHANISYAVFCLK